MKKYLFLFVSVFLMWACSQKTTSVSETAAKAMSSENMISKMGTFNTGGQINFAAANDRYSAEGSFKNWHFTKVNMKKGDVESLTASIQVDLSSIWEKNADLTAHLKAPDFFNIEKFASGTIDISNVAKASDGSYTADMKLNMKGLTQDLSSSFMVTSMNPLHVKGTAKINRVLFGLGGEGLGTGDLIAVSYDTDIPQ